MHSLGQPWLCTTVLGLTPCQPSLTHSPATGFDSLTLRAIKADEPGPNHLIPAIIHQTWKDDNIPLEWQGAQQACKDLHPTWEYRLWTDNSSHALIADKYPHLLDTYERYPYNIERADVIRCVARTGPGSGGGGSAAGHAPGRCTRR